MSQIQQPQPVYPAPVQPAYGYAPPVAVSPVLVATGGGCFNGTPRL